MSYGSNGSKSAIVSIALSATLGLSFTPAEAALERAAGATNVVDKIHEIRRLVKLHNGEISRNGIALNGVTQLAQSFCNSFNQTSGGSGSKC